MKYIPVVVILGFILVLGGAGRSAQAQSPTATPTVLTFGTHTPTATFLPIQATQTNAWSGLRPTPSALPAWSGTGIPGINIASKLGGMADGAINTYKFFNQSGLLDFVAFIGMVFAVVALLLRLKGKLDESD